MPYFTYDTSVIISRKLAELPGRTGSFLLSGIVLMEMTGSAQDDTQRKIYEQMFRAYREDNSLIIPNHEDWLQACRVLYWLNQTRRRALGGKLKRLHPGASQRMALDVLLAVSARRWRATVVTENWDDFKAIERYSRTKIVKASSFFRD